MTFDLSPLWISLRTATFATLITFFIGILAAYWMFNYRGKAKALIDGLFLLPLVLPPVVIGFLLLLLFGTNSWVGQLLRQLNITIIFSWPATVIAASVVAFPLMYKTALSAFEQIDPTLLYAARTLGASEKRVFSEVMLPLAWPGILAGTILAFARALGEFGATVMLAGNIPGKTQTIPIAIFFAAEAGKMNLALTWVIMVVAISLSAIALLNQLNHKAQKNRPFVRPKKSLSQPQFTENLKNLRVDSSAYLQVDIQKQLNDFNLTVAFSASSEPVGILGASGAGKSMLLRCLAGLETPTQGQIMLNGKELFNAKKGINIPSCDRKIGIVFQNYALFPHKTVAENIGFALQKMNRTARDRMITEQIHQMQLQGLENRYPHQLSGGQQQRVALARAIAIQPAALLLDEPFSALDTHLRSQIERQLKETLANYPGVTLFVTHNIEEAYRLCDKLLVLSGGHAIAQGLKQDILEQPKTYVVAQLTGCKNFSRAHAIAPDYLKASDWGCHLSIQEPIPESLTHVGIRAYQLQFTQEMNQVNTFPCWLVHTSETPHRITLYLKLHEPPQPNRQRLHLYEDYHLQAEVFKEKWAILKDRPFPWFIRLDPQRLILLQS